RPAPRRLQRRGPATAPPRPARLVRARSQGRAAARRRGGRLAARRRARRLRARQQARRLRSAPSGRCGRNRRLPRHPEGFAMSWTAANVGLFLHILASFWLAAGVFGGAVVRAQAKRASDLREKVAVLRVGGRLVRIFTIPGSLVAGLLGFW